MEWVASTLHTTSEHGVSSITTADAHTSAASSRLNWRPPADINGPVRFAERRKLVSARVPSHFKRSLHNGLTRSLFCFKKFKRFVPPCSTLKYCISTPTVCRCFVPSHTTNLTPWSLYWRQTAFCEVGELDSLVGTVPRLRVGRFGVWTPVGERDVLFSNSSKPSLGPKKPPINCVAGFLPGTKLPGDETDRLSPTIAEVKSRWAYTSTPPIQAYLTRTRSITFLLLSPIFIGSIIFLISPSPFLKGIQSSLTLWRRNYFFFNFSIPCI